MLKVKSNKAFHFDIASIDKKLLTGKRNLTAAEIKILESNFNVSEDPQWKNVFVSCDENVF